MQAYNDYYADSMYYQGASIGARPIEVLLYAFLVCRARDLDSPRCLNTIRTRMKQYGGYFNFSIAALVSAESFCFFAKSQHRLFLLEKYLTPSIMLRFLGLGNFSSLGQVSYSLDKVLSNDSGQSNQMLRMNDVSRSKVAFLLHLGLISTARGLLAGAYDCNEADGLPLRAAIELTAGQTIQDASRVEYFLRIGCIVNDLHMRLVFDYLRVDTFKLFIACRRPDSWAPVQYPGLTRSLLYLMLGRLWIWHWNYRIADIPKDEYTLFLYLLEHQRTPKAHAEALGSLLEEQERSDDCMDIYTGQDHNIFLGLILTILRDHMFQELRGLYQYLLCNILLIPCMARCTAPELWTSSPRAKLAEYIFRRIIQWSDEVSWKIESPLAIVQKYLRGVTYRFFDTSAAMQRWLQMLPITFYKTGQILWDGRLCPALLTPALPSYHLDLPRTEENIIVSTSSLRSDENVTSSTSGLQTFSGQIEKECYLGIYSQELRQHFPDRPKIVEDAKALMHCGILLCGMEELDLRFRDRTPSTRKKDRTTVKKWLKKLKPSSTGPSILQERLNRAGAIDIIRLLDA